jgi:bifunctional non-homologous end joining protein LigD
VKELPVTKKGEHWWFEGPAGNPVRLSNLDKVFWPDQGYTKRDLLTYYYNVADLILPHIRDRPLTMKRMPDGITGHEFYEKNAPSHTPDWIPRCNDGEIDWLMCNSIEDLLYVTNLGCIEYHPLHARCDDLEHPDYLFFDLDPNPPITFETVLAVANHVVTALDALNLPSFAKTSGSKGMQIYVPIERGPTHGQVRALVGGIGRAIRDADPERATMEHQKPKRSGKVYIDHNMNRMGANIAAVYSLRPRPEATVSTPLTREEIAEGSVLLEDFTMATVLERFERTGDLFAGMLTEKVDITPVLEAFGIGDTESKLEEYDRKRDFTKTPEPARGEASEHGNRFVIQKHAAERAGLHYDLRLERDGTLVSWAVRRGLPTVPGEKRFMARTEDHPMEYLDFEAWIPSGEYGGGEMRVFDKGTYEAPEWEDGKMTVILHGERVKGEYHLVQTKQGWLIFRSKRSGVVEGPPRLEPMMAEGGHDPFDDPDWVFEPKLDGVRTLAYVTTDGTTLQSRTGRDQTVQYPELNNLAVHVNAMYAVLDGEVVALGADGQPSFERLQQRINLTAERDVERMRASCPVYFYAFDVLWVDDRETMSLPWHERREILEGLVTEAGPIGLTLIHPEQGRQFFEAAKDLGLEGLIAKRKDSAYEPGRRSKHWRKIKAMRTLDAVIVGWTRGTGSRSDTFGALLLGAFDREDNLRFIGQVGTGFTGKLLTDLQERLRTIETDAPPTDVSVKEAHWVRPELVCEVEYLEMTKAGRLRAPSYKGLRPDKAPEDCRIDDARN